MIKKIILLFHILILFSSLVFSQNSVENRKTGKRFRQNKSIVIGVCGPHSGDLAPYGLPTLQAVQLYIDEVNAAGGILGKEIELLIKDDLCDVRLAPDIALELTSRGAVAVIGHICSGTTLVAMPLYLNEKIIVISPSATNPELTIYPGFPNFFRTISPDNAQARMMLEFAGSLHAFRIAVVYENNQYSRILAEYIQDIADSETGRIQIYSVPVEPGRNLRQAVYEIVETGSEAILFCGYAETAAQLLDNMADSGFDIPFIGSSYMANDRFLDLGRENAEGVFVCNYFEDTDNPLAEKARIAHLNAFGNDPGHFFYNGLAAIQVLVKAIENSGSLEYQILRDYMLNNKFDTSLGTISFDDNGDIKPVNCLIFEVVNGSFVPVE